MNEIRTNTDKEETLIEGTFKLSVGAILGLLIGIILLGGPFVGLLIGAPYIKGTINGEEASGFIVVFPFLIVFGFLLVAFLAIQFLKILAIKKCKFIVTNKRIYGTHSLLIANRDFSYRLDEIDNVEMVSAFGQHTLSLRFTQGHNNSIVEATYACRTPNGYSLNCFRISNLKNYKEIYEVMNKLITATKNLTDVQIDIETDKLETEKRKADALEHVATNIAVASISETKKESDTKSDYIDELRRLKKLLDDGIITKEEFDKEKKEILDNNHK